MIDQSYDSSGARTVGRLGGARDLDNPRRAVRPHGGERQRDPESRGYRAARNGGCRTHLPVLQDVLPSCGSSLPPVRSRHRSLDVARGAVVGANTGWRVALADEIRELDACRCRAHPARYASGPGGCAMSNADESARAAESIYALLRHVIFAILAVGAARPIPRFAKNALLTSGPVVAGSFGLSRRARGCWIGFGPARRAGESPG